MLLDIEHNEEVYPAQSTSRIMPKLKRIDYFLVSRRGTDPSTCMYSQQIDNKTCVIGVRFSLIAIPIED